MAQDMRKNHDFSLTNEHMQFTHNNYPIMNTLKIHRQDVSQ